MDDTEARAQIIFRRYGGEPETDLDIPMQITADELIRILWRLFGAGGEPEGRCLHMDHPIGLLWGGLSVGEAGVRTGTVLYFDDPAGEETGETGDWF